MQDINKLLYLNKVDYVVSNLHLHFIAYIWTKDKNMPPITKQDKFLIHKSDKFPFLDIRISGPWKKTWN